MFDMVTEQALRLRALRRPRATEATGAPRSSRICSICGREVATEEALFLVDRQVHCSQCHEMLAYELSKERERDAEVRAKGTKWEKGADRPG